MNRVVSGKSSSSRSAALSRRTAVLGLGSGGLAALLAGGVLPVAAQEDSATAGTPAGGRAFLTIRQYQFAPGRTMAELAPVIESGFMPLMGQVPGFLDYYLVETSDGVVSISVFADQAGAEESTRRAADFVKQNLTDFYLGPPAVTPGSIWLHGTGETMSATPAP
jgi:hypothetical protein